MGKYNEELVKAGVMLAGEGLHPTSNGVRVRFSGDKRTVIDGPFSETKELIAGFWLWQQDVGTNWRWQPQVTGRDDRHGCRRFCHAQGRYGSIEGGHSGPDCHGFSG